MFNTDLMIRADNRPLEKRPYAFYGIGMDITPYPFFGTMIDCLMPSIMVGDSVISWPFIGIDGFGIRCGVLSDKLMERLTPIIIL